MAVKELEELYAKAVELLKTLVAQPSFSREEAETAGLLEDSLRREGFDVRRKGHNIWCTATNAATAAPLLLLNSHHDTVRPVEGWQRNPFEPVEEEGKLYGLGSNDAGASAVALLAAFIYLSRLESLPYRLVLALTAEEEISGKGGVESVLPELGEVAVAIVGEPTSMQMAIAEKGLMVLDCTAGGRAGHAARNEGENALYKAIDDIQWFREYRFVKESKLLGPVKLSVTQVSAGYQHNVVPDTCSFVVDVRTNECYSNEEVLEIIRTHLASEVKPRSTRLNSSGISLEHPLVQRAKALGIACYGSPTLSDQALMPFPSVKIGPGDSVRSHTADEYILLDEVKEGIRRYIELLENIYL